MKIPRIIGIIVLGIFRYIIKFIKMLYSKGINGHLKEDIYYGFNANDG